MLNQSVPVRVNNRILDYDHLLVCGPVFPHEVVGFSGGNKYFFPGISGPEFIDLSHWLGALLTSREIIGTKETPVRRLINLAASLIPVPRSAICCVDTPDGVAGVFCGDLQSTWSQAADLSAQVHIRWVDAPYQTVLSVLPAMYSEIWTGAKGMYKMEPVVADGGEVILYAPHIHEFSLTHGAFIREIGYHVRDYFVKQPGRFDAIPAGVRAHSTHLRGQGTYDPLTGIETPRIRVTLSTGISEADCRAVNLGYRDPASIDVEEWMRRQDENLLVVPRAGEYLYRLSSEQSVNDPDCDGCIRERQVHHWSDVGGSNGLAFFDGDDFHPPANVKKMSLGIPLTDEDRAGWLAALARLIRDTLQKEQSAVLACSALKARYREQLLVDPAR